MLRFPREELERVRKRRRESGEPFAHRLGAPREADDESTPEGARESPRQHRHGGMAQAVGPQELAVAGNLALEDRPNRLRGNVPGTETGAPGRDHQLRLASGGPAAHGGDDLSLIVGNDFAGNDTEA